MLRCSKTQDLQIRMWVCGKGCAWVWVGARRLHTSFATDRHTETQRETVQEQEAETEGEGGGVGRERDRERERERETDTPQTHTATDTATDAATDTATEIGQQGDLLPRVRLWQGLQLTVPTLALRPAARAATT